MGSAVAVHGHGACDASPYSVCTMSPRFSSSATAKRYHVASVPEVAGFPGVRLGLPDSRATMVARPTPDRAASSS
jgi:hypothetical protein